MRKLAKELGVEAMSLYNHVANKTDLLDGMVDLVFAEIDAPAPGDEWRAAMRRRATSARTALARHPWATPLLESKVTPGTLQHHEAVLGCLRASGFSIGAAAHAFSLLDSYIYGFAIQELTLPFDDAEGLAAMAEELHHQLPPDEFPNMTEMIVGHVLQPGYDYWSEYEFGLDLILDALDGLRDHRSTRPTKRRSTRQSR